MKIPTFLPSMSSSASVLAKTSVRSPRKLFMFIILKNIFWIKVSKKNILFYLENRSTGSGIPLAVHEWTFEDALVTSPWKRFDLQLQYFPMRACNVWPLRVQTMIQPPPPAAQSFNMRYLFQKWRRKCISPRWYHIYDVMFSLELSSSCAGGTFGDCAPKPTAEACRWV